MRFFAQRKIFLGIIILIFLIVLLNISPFKGLVSVIRRPLMFSGSLVYSISRPINAFFFGLTNSASLAEKLSQQQKQISLLLFELEQKNQCNIEAKSDFESFPELFSAQIIKAKVISSQFDSSKHVLLIDQGENEGVFIGAPVVSLEGAFVGKVIQAHESSSFVLLATDSSSAIASALSSNRSVQAIVRGKKGISLSMELIPQDADIKTGDIVLTSLLEEKTPQGLLIGTVASVKYIEGQLFKEATLFPFISAESLDHVGVIIAPNLK